MFKAHTNCKNSRNNFFIFILQSYNFAQSWLDFAQTNVWAYATFKNSGVDYLYVSAKSAKKTFIRLVMRLVCPPSLSVHLRLQVGSILSYIRHKNFFRPAPSCSVLLHHARPTPPEIWNGVLSKLWSNRNLLMEKLEDSIFCVNIPDLQIFGPFLTILGFSW